MKIFIFNHCTIILYLDNILNQFFRNLRIEDEKLIYRINLDIFWQD